MVKRNLVGNSHHFFMIVVLSVSALGLMLFTYASQQKTNTESRASGCTQKPSLFLADSSKKNDGYVWYKLKLVNNCPNPKKFEVKVKEMPSTPTNYGREAWGWHFTTGGNSSHFQGSITTNRIESKKSDDVIFVVIRRDEYKKLMKPDSYKYFQIRASLEKNDNIYDDSFLIYNVE